MRDGELVAAINRERLTRVKHDGGHLRNRHKAQRFHAAVTSPWDLSVCIDYCLEAADIPLERIDSIVENHLLNVDFERFHREEVSAFLRPYPLEKTVMISHHLAHAYGAYYASGFDAALVMVVDGEGNSLDAVQRYGGEDSQFARGPAFAATPKTVTEKISLYSVKRGIFEPIRKDFTLGSIGGAYRVATLYIFDAP